MSLWIASFDIGKKNFAFYIEEIIKKELLAVKNVSEDTNKYNIDGTPTLEMKEILDKVYANGKTILHINADLTYDCEEGSYLDPTSFHNMNDLLDEYSEYWKKCSCFVIEEQIKRNTAMRKMGQHCYSYFTIKYGRDVKIVEFPSMYKTQTNGAKRIKGKQYKNGRYRWKTMTKPQRKKWSIERTIDILKTRKEIDVLNNLTSKQKKDDLADTLMQLQAFKYLCFIDGSA